MTFRGTATARSRFFPNFGRRFCRFGPHPRYREVLIRRRPILQPRDRTWLFSVATVSGATGQRTVWHHHRDQHQHNDGDHERHHDPAAAPHAASTDRMAPIHLYMYDPARFSLFMACDRVQTGNPSHTLPALQFLARIRSHRWRVRDPNDPRIMVAVIPVLLDHYVQHMCGKVGDVHLAAHLLTNASAVVRATRTSDGPTCCSPTTSSPFRSWLLVPWPTRRFLGSGVQFTTCPRAISLPGHPLLAKEGPVSLESRLHTRLKPGPPPCNTSANSRTSAWLRPGRL